MNYYASYGHTDFTLCLGYAADQIRSAVADAREVWDFARDWTIDCVDTGLDTPIGERLHLVADSVAGEEMFFANYSDVLTDVDLDAMVARMTNQPETDAMFLAVKPQGSFHIIDSDADGKATKVYSIGDLPIRTNGGYLLLRPAVLERLGNGKDIVPTVFTELAELGRLTSFRHDGFWMPADTFKERACSTRCGKPERPLEEVPRMSLSLTGLRHVVVAGAHCDDIAIGCGATLLALRQEFGDLVVSAFVLTGLGRLAKPRSGPRWRPSALVSD